MKTVNNLIFILIALAVAGIIWLLLPAQLKAHFSFKKQIDDSENPSML